MEPVCHFVIYMYRQRIHTARTRRCGVLHQCHEALLPKPSWHRAGVPHWQAGEHGQQQGVARRQSSGEYVLPLLHAPRLHLWDHGQNHGGNTKCRMIVFFRTTPGNKWSLYVFIFCVWIINKEFVPKVLFLYSESCPRSCTVKCMTFLYQPHLL